MTSGSTLAAAQSRLADEMAEYKAKIMAKIRRNIVMPPDLPRKSSCGIRRYAASGRGYP